MVPAFDALKLRCQKENVTRYMPLSNVRRNVRVSGGDFSKMITFHYCNYER